MALPSLKRCGVQVVNFLFFSVEALAVGFDVHGILTPQKSNGLLSKSMKARGFVHDQGQTGQDHGRTNQDSASISNVSSNASFASKTLADLQQWQADLAREEVRNLHDLQKAFTGLNNTAGKPSPYPPGVFEEMQCDILRQFSITPSLCSKQNNRIGQNTLVKYLHEFKYVWAAFQQAMPGPKPFCCMGINHRFAIYAAVKEVKPLAIIESGVASGRTTWLLRTAAGPSVPIFSIDVGDPVAMYGFQGWRDSSPNAHYMVGAAFQDLSLARWDSLIPDPKIRARTLVILDDHQSSIERLKMLRRWGFRYVFYEDNYPYGVATSADTKTCRSMPDLPRTFTSLLHGDAYSPNAVCAPLPQSAAALGRILHKDRFGHKCKWISRGQHANNVKWFQQHIKSYYEFPQIFSRCKGLKRQPLLGSDVNLLEDFGFPQPEGELWNYGHLYPALIELKPFSKKKMTMKLVNGRNWVQDNEQAKNLRAAIEATKMIRAEMLRGEWLK